MTGWRVRIHGGRGSWILFSLEGGLIVMAILVASTTPIAIPVQGVGEYYQARCGSTRPCNRTRNLACDLIARQCVCSRHSDPQFIYTYDSSTRICVESLSSELSAYKNCKFVITRRQSNQPHDCKSNFDCEETLGQYGRCNPENCICECRPESRLGQLELKNGKCVVRRQYNESCTQLEEECNEDNHEMCDKNSGVCACEPRYQWSEFKNKCVLRVLRCDMDAQCIGEDNYGAHAVCDQMRQCVCMQGAKMHAQTQKCWYPLQFGESCEHNAECELGLGANSLCVTNDSVNWSVCICTPGYSLVSGKCTPGSNANNDSLKINDRHLQDDQSISMSATPKFYEHAITVGILASLVLVLSMLVLCCLRLSRTLCPKRKGKFVKQTAQVPLLEMASKIPHVNRAEFSIDNSRILGRGKCGVVYEGKFGSVAIAVKTLNPECNRVDMYLDSLDQEVQIFKHLPEHEHIIKLLAYSVGHSTESFILMELCANGSLRTFLTRATYQEAPALEHVMENPNMKTSAEPALGSGESSYTLRDLFNFAQQIAVAGEFLAEHRVVHGDIACRNVLLDSKLVAKLTDFGLGRKLGESPTYIKTTNEMKPWKWSAPEVLVQNKCSTKSDVWSFGVTLWELFSRGAEPYAGQEYGQSFPRDLYQGFHRLPRPQLASIQLYRLMMKCWQSEPTSRIGFHELRIGLATLINVDLPPNYEDGLQIKVGRDGYLLSS